jgi:formylmethanofuran dehydrogenase subunit E
MDYGGLIMFEFPDWVFEFHGHKCPFMPLGYRMGLFALKAMELDRSKDHDFWIISEMGVRHPQTCLIDGIQAATGCTYGKGMIRRLHYGKYGMFLYHPQKGACHISVKPEFIATLHKEGAEFFKVRKQGLQPSQVPREVADQAIKPVAESRDEEMFTFTKLSDFRVQKPTGTWQRTRCDKCGEDVFEIYVRLQDGRKLCIPCLEPGAEPYNEPPIKIITG